MKLTVFPNRQKFARDPMIYGHFLEHFHRQIYGGVFEPGSPLSDEQGFRKDVIEALRHIQVPVIRWPGGCFVSSYHWQDGVGKDRIPTYDKTWRVEDDNSFGTDEFIELCRKLDCEPYICLNAGSGSVEEMSDWVEYCNLDHEGRFARMRIANGYEKPHKVKYWSIGNENYSKFELGAWSAEEWSRIVTEGAKFISHVDPDTELTAAALDDVDWNVKLLSKAGERLQWISIHGYWDGLWHVDDPAGYEAVCAMCNHTGDAIRRVRGLLAAMGMDKNVRIAFDEWNLRGWHHPNLHTVRQGRTPEEYLIPRDRNDINSVYTMADAVFAGCFLNDVLRNADIVGMANYAPAVNTRGCLYVHKDGIVKRTTYHVFDLFVNRMGDVVLESWTDGGDVFSATAKDGVTVESVPAVNAVATLDTKSGKVCISAVNLHAKEEKVLTLSGLTGEIHTFSLSGDSTEAYNDVGLTRADIETDVLKVEQADGEIRVTLPAHSVNVIQVG